MFKPIGSLIRNLHTRSKTSNAILAIHVIKEAEKSIREICKDLPTKFLDAIKVSTFKNGVLTIQTTALMSSELQARSEELKNAVNKALGKKMVNRLRFRAK